MEKTENALNGPVVNFPNVVKALFPTGLLIIILIITRLQQLPFKSIMNDTTSWFSVQLGSLGTFDISRGLILSLKDIFSTQISASYKLLYVPALLPFIVTVLIAIPIFSITKTQAKDIFASSFKQTKNPFFALVGALIMVNLMLVGGDNSMVKIIGKSFAEATGQYWTIFSSYLGAVGAFFSGSNTVSNLTFGSVQLSTAELTGLSSTLILALQSVGGSMGNMVCINNIVAVSSVLNINNVEGVIIKRTVLPMIIYGIIAAIVAITIVPLIY